MEYVAELRRLTTQCKYSGFLDESIRDQFLWDLRSEAIQKHLLTEKDLTLAGAVQLAQWKYIWGCSNGHIRHDA